MRARLEELRKELETGQAELQKVEDQRMYLSETMFRISGAIQVLEELLSEPQPPATKANEAAVHESDVQSGKE
jgi:predicted nuclease with TOPRIM domain